MKLVSVVIAPWVAIRNPHDLHPARSKLGQLEDKRVTGQTPA